MIVVRVIAVMIGVFLIVLGSAMIVQAFEKGRWLAGEAAISGAFGVLLVGAGWWMATL